MAGIFGTILGLFGHGKTVGKNYQLAAIYKDLRNKVLSLNPSEIGLSRTDKNPVWGVIMETGYADAVVTLVTIADGTVSLYISNGGGIIGIGQHDGPRKACLSFLSQSLRFIQYAKPTSSFPLPKEGYTRFYFLTYDGIFTVENVEGDLGNERLPLSPLFLKAHEVIAQARLVDEQLKNNFQNLMHAATTGDTEEVKRLIKEGNDPNRSDKTGLTPLMAAAYKGQDHVLISLIEFKCDIDAKDESGYTALMFASNAGHVSSAKILIEAGADVNSKDNDSSTPIMFASQNGNNELVRLLLKHGADPKIKGNHGLSAIGFAQQNGHKETEKILKQPSNRFE